MLTLKNINDFKNVTEGYNISINNHQLNLFQKYHAFLIEWNEKINLISRKQNEGENDVILERHFLDSIIFLTEIEHLSCEPRAESYESSFPVSQLPVPSSVLDIGSGGGFPAIPLAIMKPEWDFTLCESISKKANFLGELIKYLGLTNVTIKNNRVEEMSSVRACHGKPQQYDLITVRAVAKIDELIKYSLPLLKKGGSLLAFKGPAYEEELKNAKGLIESKKLKVEVFSKEVNGIEKKLVVITPP